MCHVMPLGQAYLTRLEIFMGNFHDTPFQPCTPPRGTDADLDWWHSHLHLPSPPQPLPERIVLHDHSAFSDASSGVGLGITVGEYWHAWTLVGDWQSQGHDIGWAKADTFELLARTLTSLFGPNNNFRCHGDNTRVVEGWWKGSSKNSQTNAVFRRIHDFSESAGVHFHTRYVPSQHNPADAPSRGILGPPSCLLPPVPLPSTLLPFIQDVSDPSAWPRDLELPSKPHKPQGNVEHQPGSNRHRERLSEEFLAASAARCDA